MNNKLGRLLKFLRHENKITMAQNPSITAMLASKVSYSSSCEYSSLHEVHPLVLATSHTYP
jgi:hypothetical protein